VTQSIQTKQLFFLFFSIMTILIFSAPLKMLFVQSFHDEVYDYIALIPLVSLYFLYVQRKELFAATAYSFPAGITIILFGVVFYRIGMQQVSGSNQIGSLSLVTLSIVIFWIGGFVLFHGVDVLRKALFPLLFLFFIVPLPAVLLEKIISFLQEGSAEVTYVLFHLSGVPVFREGFIFHLPKISIEVATQCSGIHSGIALLITSVIAAKLFLATGWRKGVLILSVIPITIVKNGLRIVTLSLLGNNIDERILSSPLHRKGGIPFFILALLVLFTVLWLLRRSEQRMGTTGSSPSAGMGGRHDPSSITGAT
jgi:exosortase